MIGLVTNHENIMQTNKNVAKAIIQNVQREAIISQTCSLSRGPLPIGPNTNQYVGTAFYHMFNITTRGLWWGRPTSSAAPSPHFLFST